MKNYSVEDFYFKHQLNTVSEGRFPDGNNSFIQFTNLETPGASNRIDKNLNGLPDDWEARYNFDSIDANIVQSDFDGDGLTNFNEYLAGSDPTDVASNLALVSVRITSNNILIEFIAHAGASYLLQEASNLAQGKWRTVARLNSRAISGPVIITEPLAQQQQNRFYRLKIR